MNSIIDESSELVLAETGIYEGPDEIQEYVNFIKADFFEYYKRSSALDTIPILLTDDECSVLFVTTNKLQIKSKYQSEGACLETAVGYTLHFTPKPFKVTRISLYYSRDFLSALFDKALDSGGVRKYVCDIMEINCRETFDLNNLTSSSCQSTYDSLPLSNGEGYLDGKSTACRILHSAFAAQNKDHCPHLSFVPQMDLKGRVKCQESKEHKPSDFFSSFELETIKKRGHELGFPDSLCEFSLVLLIASKCIFLGYLTSSRVNVLYARQGMQLQPNI